MKSAYFTIHPGKNPPPQIGCRLKSAYFTIHPGKNPLPQNGWQLKYVFIYLKSTGRHYTKYRFSVDIGAGIGCFS
jgi:hypothetical protein